MEEERSSEARARAEQALVWLLSGLDAAEVELIVLGGLVPEVLTRGQDVEPQPPAHLGTTDVDILLITHIDQGDDLGAVERRLRSLEFRPEEDGWRWRGRVDGRGIKIEFLCDLENHPQAEVISPRGCSTLAACNLRGTGYVARDWEWQDLASKDQDGRPITVRARFAGLQGYLLSKAVAVRARGAEKDYYDLPYVLIHNRAGGPRQAAEMLVNGELSQAVVDLESTFREVAARYASHSAFAVGVLRIADAPG